MGQYSFQLGALAADGMTTERWSNIVNVRLGFEEILLEASG